MDEIIGCGNRILYIDLTGKTWELFEVTEADRRMYLGGKGLGLKLLFDRLKPGIDPLGPDNLIAVMPGVIMGSGGPCSGRFAAVTKSPLTGIMASSSCGGPFGMQLKTAGYDGLIIRGRSDLPCTIHLGHDSVEFKDAVHLWGLDAMAAQEKIVEKSAAALVIGPAGENQVRFATVSSGHRVLGRGGFGAVMGSKNLKGVVARGGQVKIVPANVKQFSKLKKRANRYIKKNEQAGTLKEFGTAGLFVNSMNKSGMLPVWNWAFSSHDQAVRLSGRMIKAKNSTEFKPCKPCSILCGHTGMFSGKNSPVPEYETLALMGANLGIFDRDVIARFNDTCNRLGMDTVSAGGTLAWVMEAAEKGLLKSSLCFGCQDGIVEALEDIGYCRGFGREMALGTRALSGIYGGREFAMQVKGLELPGYDPRGAYGQGLAYAVANRGGCHLSAHLVSLEVITGFLLPESTWGKPAYVTFLEDLTCSVNSIQTCQFTLYPYLLETPLMRFAPKRLIKYLMQRHPGLALKLFNISLYPDLYSAATGIKLSRKAFLKAGERVHLLERHMNCREGITRKDDTLPDRLLYEPRHHDEKRQMVPLDEMLPDYYKKRGYDAEGIPMKSRLEKLGIPWEPMGQ